MMFNSPCLWLLSTWTILGILLCNGDIHQYPYLMWNFTHYLQPCLYLFPCAFYSISALSLGCSEILGLLFVSSQLTTFLCGYLCYPWMIRVGLFDAPNVPSWMWIWRNTHYPQIVQLITTLCCTCQGNCGIDVLPEVCWACLGGLCTMAPLSCCLVT